MPSVVVRSPKSVSPRGGCITCFCGVSLCCPLAATQRRLADKRTHQHQGVCVAAKCALLGWFSGT